MDIIQEIISLLKVDGKSLESIEYMLRHFYYLGDNNENFNDDVNIQKD